ncbi:MAG: universal stress protein [Nitrospirota bacterium]
MYKNILVAFDGSEVSRAALIESSNWIKRHGGKVIMVHAVYFDEEEFSLAPEQREERFELGKKVCYQTRETISSEFGIEVESLVCEGEPPDVITDIAAGKKADLIAMGTYGRKGLKRLVMGSVTSKVIINAPCDVMVVKRPCSECTGEYESILVPFDGSQFSKKALEHACELSRKDNAEITVLYVIPRYEEMVGFFRTESIKQNLYQEAQKIMDEAKKIAVSNGVSISTTIQEGQAAEKIIETANALKNDLMIMGSYGWRGINKVIIGSTTERVIMNASCPVLVVK